MELPAGLTPPPSDLVASLRAALAPDRVAIPGDPNYAAFHKSDNRDLAETFPCAIARCLSAEEVAAALLACRRHNLPISIAAGRHSAKFFRHNAVCIDLRLISYVKVDPETRIARVGAGTKNGELDAACEKFGMFVTAGTNTDTGVAGLTLGGGYGWVDQSKARVCRARDSLIARSFSLDT